MAVNGLDETVAPEPSTVKRRGDGKRWRTFRPVR